MKKRGQFLSRLLLIVLISLVLGGSAYSWNARAVGNNAMPMPFGYGVSVVLSGSMEPTLHVNDLVLIRAADSYEPGDVIVYQAGSLLVIHRLVETDGTTAVTRGDANNTNDEPIPTYLIKGKLVGRLTGVGVAVRFLQSAPGVSLILAAAAYLLIRSHRSERAAAAAETEQIRQEIEKLKAEMLSEHTPPEGQDTETGAQER